MAQDHRLQPGRRLAQGTKPCKGCKPFSYSVRCGSQIKTNGDPRPMLNLCHGFTRVSPGVPSESAGGGQVQAHGLAVCSSARSQFFCRRRRNNRSAPPMQATPPTPYPICQGNLDVSEGSKLARNPTRQNPVRARSASAIVIRVVLFMSRRVHWTRDCALVPNVAPHWRGTTCQIAPRDASPASGAAGLFGICGWVRYHRSLMVEE